ncbi:hypothetical protein J7438_16380 [Thalassotalea sp. G20_0]|uniref:RAP domain-containing protein n=1 Tax=Thalassotalea sp. G20_0 TaxID=2821093 RepID=UPI001ADB1E60|nr:RAP domain-containing protein [Thalassotalea sp. G20_0]MBO9495654.1 hypothetical protein [Thalassotalea sp. G20_0]
MNKNSAGISGQCARSDNGYNQPGNQAARSRRGRYRHATVRQWDNPPHTAAPGRDEFYHSSGTHSSQYLLPRSVNPAQDFNAFIKQEVMDDLVSKSDHFGHRYDGRNHSQYASSIKKYTTAAKRPLNRVEQRQLMRFLQNFTVTRSWNWRSLTTTLHSLTSAGAFTPHNPMDQRVKRTQAALLSTLLDAIIFKCNRKAEAWDIDARGVASLLWAIAKLVDIGQKRTPEFQEAVAALLPHMNAQKDQFIPQHIANLLWAMAKLAENGQEQTPELKEAVAALLPHVNAMKDQFTSQHIANLLWAMAKLGELAELNMVTSTFKSLVYRISGNPQVSMQAISMSLWGVMVCCARLTLVSNKNNKLEKHIDALFTRLKTTFPDNEEEQSIIAMAASWLGRPCPFIPRYQTIISKPQTFFREQLQLCMPSLQIEEEKSLNFLPPVDLLLPDRNIIIEVQGPSHYVRGDFNTRNGSTLLKIALLQKAGFEVIEIPINQLRREDSTKRRIDQIKTRVDIPPKGHASVSLKVTAQNLVVKMHFLEKFYRFYWAAEVSV